MLPVSPSSITIVSGVFGEAGSPVDIRLPVSAPFR